MNKINVVLGAMEVAVTPDECLCNATQAKGVIVFFFFFF